MTIRPVFLAALLSLPAAAQNLPDGAGKEPFAKICAECHGLERATNLKLARAGWQELVDRMAAKGASGSAAEMASIVDYLARNFAKEEAPAPAKEMPEGAGKQIILRECTGCHQPSHFTQYHHTPDEWQVIVARMGTRARNISKPELDTVTAYLTANFPKIENTDASRVNLNKAGVEEIESRLGLTAAEAQAIVHYREAHGDFKEWRDLLIIYGVNGKKVQALQNKLAF